MYWSNPHDQTLEELPFQERPALPPPREEEDTKDLSREVNMVHLMEIDNEDDSIERVNLDDYDSDDFKEHLSDDDMQAAQTTTEVKANPNHESSSNSHGHRQVGG